MDDPGKLFVGFEIIESFNIRVSACERETEIERQGRGMRVYRVGDKWSLVI